MIWLILYIVFSYIFVISVLIIGKLIISDFYALFIVLYLLGEKPHLSPDYLREKDNGIFLISSPLSAIIIIIMCFGCLIGCGAYYMYCKFTQIPDILVVKIREKFLDYRDKLTEEIKNV